MGTNVVETWQINPDAEADDLEAKQPFVDNGLDILDPRRYYDPDFMALEWERMWTRTWLKSRAKEASMPWRASWSNGLPLARNARRISNPAARVCWRTRCGDRLGGFFSAWGWREMALRFIPFTLSATRRRGQRQAACSCDQVHERATSPGTFSFRAAPRSRAPAGRTLAKSAAVNYIGVKNQP